VKLFLATMFLGVTTMAQAAFIGCTPGQADTVVNATGTSAVFTCNVGAGADAGSGDDNLVGDLFNITQIRIRVSGTFQENNAASVGQNFAVLFTSVNTGVNFAIGNVGCTATGAANNDRQAVGICTGTSSFVGVTGTPDFVGAFNVTVSGGAGSTPLPFNASSSVFYEVTTAAVPTNNDIPEPTTFALMGSALLGLGVLARRRS
jgi:hypothetical protein